MVEYDAQADILRILLEDVPIEESDEVQPGVIVDYDANGHIIGFEVLDASKRLIQSDTKAQTA